MQKFLAGVSLVGCGSAVPSQTLTNEQLSQVVDTSDDWIASRTGIRQRHIVVPPPGLESVLMAENNENRESVTSLAAQACKAAIAMAKVQPEEIDLILLATSTADDLFGTAPRIQPQIGANRAIAFDLTAACSGFIFGLITAAQYIRTGTYKNILLIGGDIQSRWVDWGDRRTCILFGDGAGAVLLQASEQDNLLGFEMRSDGTGNGLLNLDYDASKAGYDCITMNGREVYRFAVKAVPEVLEKALYRANLTVDDIDWLIMHQANQRILDAVGDRIGIPAAKIVSNMAKYGNTSAASIPLAIDEWVRAGKVKPGDVIASAGFGAGLSWGGAIFKWG
ncbi:3-oxoacyl-(acyl-carrier-protein) synthase 3 [Thalassoporum mexicanum PCC 7367]|uniref:beta-ketoacyl-ACP synthase 3 n=1 Tax=Thalassoporum mexicanum TaxID=3457544 RepID=UPI00029FFAEE|nr:beta-ketoacyl-ACP synthase 3 [Pseudanabaena sp. PCC 7367]AFY71071.1 3-oxoacyl-(acyl-carrier-protein) synthase 3 [Pseudanabaena sp. PCC 7367]